MELLEDVVITGLHVGAAWPKQIEPGHWEDEPRPDPVEYIVRPISEWSGR